MVLLKNSEDISKIMALHGKKQCLIPYTKLTEETVIAFKLIFKYYGIYT